MRMMGGLAAVCSCVLLGLLAAGQLPPGVQSDARSVCWLTDFDGRYCAESTYALNVPPILGYDAFYGGPGNPSTAAVACVVDAKEPQTHSRVARVEYNVARLRTYAGFWMQWNVEAFSIKQWDTLFFDVRGCDPAVDGDCSGSGGAYQGFTTRFKVELKIRGWGWQTAYVEGVTSEWRRIEIPLSDFVDTTWDVPPVDEFVITFEQRVATASRGAIYIDNIGFAKED